MSTDLPQFEHYAEGPRLEVLPYLPDGVRSAVRIGCGQGGFGLTLRTRYPNARLMGIEATASQSKLASLSHGFDEALHGYCPHVLDDRFDLMTFNDVLERTFEPWTVVEGLHGRFRHFVFAVGSGGASANPTSTDSDRLQAGPAPRPTPA